MTMTTQVASMRIARELVTSETEIDRALESSASLLASMARARLETGATAETGQIAMMRLAGTLSALVEARKGIIQTHSELRKVGEERADIIFPSDCPNALDEDEGNSRRIAA